jgi:hypothetical protein
MNKYHALLSYLRFEEYRKENGYIIYKRTFNPASYIAVDIHEHVWIYFGQHFLSADLLYKQVPESEYKLYKFLSLYGINR